MIDLKNWKQERIVELEWELDEIKATWQVYVDAVDRNADIEAIGRIWDHMEYMCLKASEPNGKSSVLDLHSVPKDVEAFSNALMKLSKAARFIEVGNE